MATTYLHRTPSSSSNQRKWTFSTWIKRSTVGEGSGPEEFIMYGRPGSNTDTRLYFTGDGNANDDRLYFQSTTDNTTHTALQTNRKFRDTSAWYNIVISANTEDGNGSSSTIKMFINGVQETSFATETYGVQNKLFYWTDDCLTTLGIRSENNGQHFHGYIAETVLIDGQALDADSFGEFDEDSPGIWKPKSVSGLTFGTNGFYLEFKQSGTSQNSSGMGADTSGNDNHYATGGLAAVDQSIDTCTNNFATLNPLDVTRLSNVGNTFTEGNLVVTDGSSNYLVANGSIAVEAGKWYFEVKMIESTDTHIASGVMVVNLDADDKTDGAANGDHGWLYATNGQKRNAGSSSNYGDTYTQNDIIGVALDMDNKAIYFSKNGTFQASGDPTSGASKTNAAYTNLAGTITAQVYDGQGAEAHEFSMNFGSPHHAVSSGNADANGYGNFEYTVPSGYFALCTKNLAEYG